ncbi:MAG: hypothetical protein DHS20C08_03370 [Rhodomicrobium sp.]|nr:MAG: hypothetical protein DHS20C08_03370 [Rhodomicrobium sp.]
MFRKIIAVAALIGVGVMAQSSIASAHQSTKYHSHKKNAYEKPYKNKHMKHKYKKNKKHKYYNNYGFKKHHGNRIGKIRRKLRNRGFYNIRFTDRYLPIYKAVACKRGKRLKLTMNRWGNVMWRKRVGWCG